ncbi:DoxX family membrane protein [Kribbella qitaiheensis]|uniref:DoxX family membrane protein n=1 Tax=Kribbella qitaiheensis TaxID=1544730 RepID=UPI0036091104
MDIRATLAGTPYGRVPGTGYYRGWGSRSAVAGGTRRGPGNRDAEVVISREREKPTMNALLVKGNTITGWLGRRSIDILRISLGLVFLAFGILKFFPGASPAEALVIRTIDTLTLGVINGQAALLLTAVMECFIGITLVTGKLLRTGLLVLGFSLVGIMSPLVLFSGDLFPGTPTLEAQYVFKDIVLAAAGLVIAAKALAAAPLKRLSV